MKKIVLMILVVITIIMVSIGYNNKDNDTKESNILDMSSDILAFTIDGETTSSMPSKDSGYIVKSITCDNGSLLIWDNTNWLVEVENLESEDSCKIDFTKTSISSVPLVTITHDDTPLTGTQDFSYTGAVQTFTVPSDGTYKLEVWGAQGGSYSTYYGGAGGYSVGTVSLSAGDVLYVYVGGQPTSSSSTSTTITGGFNGGGQARVHAYSGTTTYCQAGGGASDIRIGQDSLYARVIVAGGGGGSASIDALTTKYGGGASGGSPSSSFASSQTAGGTNGSFGVGANGYISGYNYKYASGGGGGGWYGGGAVNAHSDSASDYRNQNGGGSGYVYTSSTASNYPSGCLLNSSYYLTDAQTIAGNSSFPTTDGTSTETGHQGNGYAKITYDITPIDYTTNFDSKSKTTTYGGNVTFYATADIVSVTGCTNEIIDSRKFVVSNVTGNVTCTVITK